MRMTPLLAAAALCATFALVSGCAHAPRATTQTAPASASPYQQRDILQEAETFFGNGARGVADVINRLFVQNGPPDAYIKGEESGGAIGFGLRYGHGTLYFKDGTSTEVYWRGPSLGFDIGGNASKTFVMIYHLPNIDALYQRFGGVEGSLYYVAGVGFTYNRNGPILVAPVRFGVGWRQGINVGYLHFSPRRTWFPF